MDEKTLLKLLVGVVAISLIVSVFGFFSLSGNLDVPTAAEVAALVVIPAAAEVNVPTAQEIADLVVIPEVESADNALLNDFLENEFSEEYDVIEGNATEYAFEELEDHDFRVIVKYLKTLLTEGEELDEDSIQIGGKDLDQAKIGDLEDVDVTVTKLGLGEDDDKSATVTFELEVEYELEEGVRDEFEQDFVVTFDVVFDEGDFGDEEVELVSIL